MEVPCRICASPEVASIVQDLRDQGHGYKRVYRELKWGRHSESFSRGEVQLHCSHVMRNIQSSIDDAIDRAEMVVDDDYFRSRGIAEPPEGFKWVAATVEESGPGGQRHWVRIRPESEDEPEEDERVEIRQAEPVIVEGVRPGLTIIVPSKWETWMINPDCQIGYWLSSAGLWYATHDERCFVIGHAVAQAIAESEGLHGWLDLGDLLDLAAPSRHNPPPIDLHAAGLNKATQRCSEEFARRRFVVGPEGELVVMEGNHDLRFRTKANQQMPYLVGLRRAGDPEEEHPVLTVPYLTRARDHGVDWNPSYPSGYRRLNGNLLAFHSPAYGGKALESSRKISAKVHASVVFGHTHRRESLAENIETDKGVRTLEVWSDGCWARSDGSLPSERNVFDGDGNRKFATTEGKWGMLSENFHQGFSIVHVETEGRERFSVERVAIWDGYAQFRGQDFFADCDANGDPLEEAQAA